VTADCGDDRRVIVGDEKETTMAKAPAKAVVNEHEGKLIDETYDAQVKEFYKIFFNSYLTARQDEAAQRAAADHFRTAVETARAIRDIGKDSLA
jgi:hypothetical protein